MTNAPKFYKSIFLFLIFALVAACAQKEAIKRDFDNDKLAAQSALKQIEPTKKRQGSLIIDERPWYGSKSVPLSDGDPLPSKFTRDDSLVITFPQPLSLTEIRSEIQKVTGIRVVFDRATESSDARFLPADGLIVTGGRVVWQGSLETLLNQISDAFDIGWDYNNGTIRIFEEVTKTFMLHALATNVDLSASLESGTSAEGLPGVDIEDTTELKLWDEIGDTLNNILNNRGRISLSPSTGTITVSAAPTLIERVEDYLRKQNSLRLRRVAVAVKVLEIRVNNNTSYGFDLFAELENAIDGQPLQLSSIDGSLSAGILRKVGSVGGAEVSGNAIDDFAAVLSASEDISHVSISNSGAVVTLSDQPAPLQIGRQISYLARVSAAASGDSTGTSLEPGTIDVGLTMNILPRVIENNRVLMRLALSLTSVEEPFETFSSSDATIQLPEIETTGFLQNAVLSEGETLVLAGFERQQSGITDDRSVGFLLGGTRSFNQDREITVLLISAEILPEEPVRVITNYR